MLLFIISLRPQVKPKGPACKVPFFEAKAAQVILSYLIGVSFASCKTFIPSYVFLAPGM